MKEQIDFVNKLEAELNFQFSKTFKKIVFVVSLLTAIILVFIEASSKANHPSVVQVLWVILIVIWPSAAIYLLCDFIKFLKNEWDMRWVMTKSGDPINALYAKKMNIRFRKMTKKEKRKYKKAWGENHPEKYKEKDVPFISKEDAIDMKLNDPDLPMEEFIKITNEQEKMKTKTS